MIRLEAQVGGDIMNRAKCYLKPGFSTDSRYDWHWLDRSSAHFTRNSFTDDTSWHDVDISAYVPSSAKAIAFKIRVEDGAVEKSMRICAPSVTKQSNMAMSVWTQVANVKNENAGVVGCEGQKVQVGFPEQKPTAFAVASLWIEGWLG